MLGYTHAMMGATAGLLTLPLLGETDPWSQIGWTSAAAAAALVPDLDHPESTASRMWGPLTQAISAVVELASGGHRWGTHDAVLASLAIGALAWACGHSPIALTVLFAICLGLVLSLLRLRGGLLLSALNFVAAWWCAIQITTSTHAVTIAQVLPAALVLGVLVHILGDQDRQHHRRSCPRPPSSPSQRYASRGVTRRG